MNTEKIYNAQLNVSKYITAYAVNDLISRLSVIGKECYYNSESKSIDIELYENIEIEDKVKSFVKDWLVSTLAEANSDDFDTIYNNFDFVFRIMRLSSPNKEDIIKVYLY